MHRVQRWTRQIAFTLSLAVTPLLSVACGGAGEAPELDREVFIATYVDLRAEALLSDTQELTDDQRTLVLDEHGVEEADLLTFTEHYGEDVEFMRDLWDEVEERLDALRPAIDESGDLVRPIQRPSERISEGRSGS